MKLTNEDIKNIIIEDEENEAINYEHSLYSEHEDAGDRV